MEYGYRGLADRVGIHSERVTEIGEAIISTPAEGPEGIAVKLRFATPGVPADTYDVDDRAVLSALADAERLARTS